MTKPEDTTGVYVLMDRLRELDAQRATIRAQIAEALGETHALASVHAWADLPLPRRRRPSRGRPGQTADGRSLAQVLDALLAGRTMSVSQLVRAVQAAGYVTRSKHFRCIVTTTLGAHPGRFIRVGHGKYTATPSGTRPPQADFTMRAAGRTGSQASGASATT